jgi:hypothetical protein
MSAGRDNGAWMTIEDEGGNEVKVELDYNKIAERLKTKALG